MKYPKIIQLLWKRHKGDLSGEEKKELDQWLKAGPANRKEAKLHDEIWDLSGQYKAGYEPDPEAGLAGFRRRVREEQPAADRTGIWGLLLLLLLIALLAALGWVLWQRSQPAPVSNGPVAVATGVEEQRSLDLPDGSRVFLNEKSSLSFAGEWPADAVREVVLEGEAFFEVPSRAGVSFIVHTADTEIQVLGTAFNVRAYRDEPETAVTVEEGRVEFRTNDQRQTLMLETNDKGICEHGGLMYPIQDAGINARPWQSGVLRFRKTPMREVVRSLQQYFGVVIDLNPSNIADCTFTSGPVQQEELDQLLQALEAVYEVRLERPGPDTVRVYGGRRCSE